MGALDVFVAELGVFFVFFSSFFFPEFIQQLVQCALIPRLRLVPPIAFQMLTRQKELLKVLFSWPHLSEANVCLSLSACVSPSAHTGRHKSESQQLAVMCQKRRLRSMCLKKMG